METIKCDKTTEEWFSQHPEAVTTLTKCEHCGKYYKWSLGHVCEMLPRQTEDDVLQARVARAYSEMTKRGRRRKSDHST